MTQLVVELAAVVFLWTRTLDHWRSHHSQQSLAQLDLVA